MQKLSRPNSVSGGKIGAILCLSSGLMIGPSRHLIIAMFMKVWFIIWRTGDLLAEKNRIDLWQRGWAVDCMSSAVKPDGEDDIGSCRLDYRMIFIDLNRISISNKVDSSVKFFAVVLCS